MSTTVHVSGISHETSEKEVKDFFSFCGKITNLSITPVSGEATTEKSATVTFEKETAAKTALLLDNTQLGKSQVKVATASTIDDVAAKAGSHATTEHDHIAQEDKPKSRIVAEYLAHGYTLSDQVIQKAISVDQKGGYSSRFQSLLTTLDQKTGATGKAKEADAKFNISNKAMGAWSGLNSYFEKALGTPTGQRIHQFYLEGDKQVRDVHNEARRLADMKTGGTPAATGKHEPEHQPGTDSKTVCSCAGSDGVCGCAPGQCDCAGCAKNNAQRQNPPVKVEKTSGLTTCGCGANSEVCGCKPGECACKNCGKSSTEHTVEAREAAQATGQQLPTGSV